MVADISKSCGMDGQVCENTEFANMKHVLISRSRSMKIVLKEQLMFEDRTDRKIACERKLHHLKTVKPSVAMGPPIIVINRYDNRMCSVQWSLRRIL